MTEDKKYYPALDGLRVVAFMMVFLFHLHVPGFGLGWAGVTLFFVISGFLITGILLDTKSTLHYFRNFYVRRSLRIFPIYYLTLGVVVLFAVLTAQQLKIAPYFFVYAQNVAYAIQGNTRGFPQFFSHTWSLAMEEQFYLIYPAVVLVLSRRSLKWFLIACLVIAPVYRLLPNLGILHDRSGNYLLLSRLDALAIGGLGLMALRSVRIPRITLNRTLIIWFAVTTGLMIALWVMTGPDTYYKTAKYLKFTPNLGLNSLLAFWFGPMVLGLALLPGFPILTLAWVRYLGKISYGLYLYHRPLIYLTDSVTAGWIPNPTLETQVLMGFFKLGLTIAVAALSWKYIETPLLGLKERWTIRDPKPAPASGTSLPEPAQRPDPALSS